MLSCVSLLLSVGVSLVKVGDLNVKPTKIPCLLKGITAVIWVDLQGAWARTAGVDPDVTCKRDRACLRGTRRNFIFGCPLAAAALGGCWVDGSRWIQRHFSFFFFSSFVSL